MKKFSPLQWNILEAGKTYDNETGQVQLRSSQATALYIEQDGVEALFGVGTQHDCKVTPPFRYRVDAPKGTKVFVFSPLSRVVLTKGEVFTNMDRQPAESGSMLGVQRTLRAAEMRMKRQLDDAMANLREDREAPDAETSDERKDRLEKRQQRADERKAKREAEKAAALAKGQDELAGIPSNEEDED